MLKLLQTFRIVAFLEGVSYILLLFIASPIKWFLDDATYVKWLGMPHGVLFITYIIFAAILKKTMHWNTKIFAIIIFAALIPFGTFYVDKQYLKHKHA